MNEKNMKTTVGKLKQIVKETLDEPDFSEMASSEPGFSREVNRIMTPEEAAARATKMGLDPRLVAWISDDFRKMREYADEFARDNYKWDEEELDNRGVGENGKAALGQTWEHTFEELGKAMGLDPYSDKSQDEVERVFSAFYEE